MQMRKNVNNDVSMNPPMHIAVRPSKIFADQISDNFNSGIMKIFLVFCAVFLCWTIVDGKII